MSIRPKKSLVISIRVWDSLFEQIRCVANQREWTIAHAALHLIQLGLESLGPEV